MNIVEFFVAFLIWIVAPVTAIIAWVGNGTLSGLICTAGTILIWVWASRFDSKASRSRIEAQESSSNPSYSFRSEWKEMLVCTGPMGEFWLEFSMGIPTVLLPTKEQWVKTFPNHNYSDFKLAVTEWLNSNNISYSSGGTINE